MRQEFGLSVGKSAVGVYWQPHVLQQQQDDTAILQQLRVLAWTALVRPFPDLDRAANLLAMVYRAEQHALSLKPLALEERRVA